MYERLEELRHAGKPGYQPGRRRRFQFTLGALLILTLAAACFFGGIHFERERRRAEEQKPLGEQIGEAGERSASGDAN